MTQSTMVRPAHRSTRRWLLSFVLAIIAAMSMRAHGAPKASAAPTQAAIALAPTGTLSPSLEIVPDTDGERMTLFMRGENIGGVAYVNIGEGPTGHKPGWTMEYSSTAQADVAVVSGFAPRTSVSGSLNITTTEHLSTRTVNFERVFVQGRTSQTIYSADGNLELQLVNRDTITTDSYVAIVPSFAPPGPLPAGDQLVGDVYSIRAAAPLVSSNKPMNVRLHYDESILAHADPHLLTILAWDAASERWDDLGGQLVQDQSYLSIATTRFTTFALAMTSSWHDAFYDQRGLSTHSNIRDGGGPVTLAEGAGSGVAISTPITPTQAATGWDTVSFTSSAFPPTTTLTVDVLDSDGSALLTNIANNTSLASIDLSQHPSLRLGVHLTSEVVGQSPTLATWRVSWQAPALPEAVQTRAPSQPLVLVPPVTGSAMPQSIIDRSTLVIFANKTPYTLVQVRRHLDGGAWETEPPNIIGPNSEAHWQSETNGFLTGTEGWVRYRLPRDTVPDPFPDAETFYIHHNNPFIGSNSYDAAVPASQAWNFAITWTGGKGNHATVTFTLNCMVEGRIDVNCDHIPDEWNWYATVVDANGNPFPGATVYVDGQASHTTDGLGHAPLAPLQSNQPLVAVSPALYTQPTTRGAHDGRAYTVHITNVAWSPDSQPVMFTATSPGEQRLVLQRTNVLILFNLVVSVEWDADQAYLQEIAEAMRHASDYLYDASDATMAFGQVTIFKNGSNWNDADLQISASNRVRPHAPIGGMFDADHAHSIRLGRGWNGSNGSEGAWNQPQGYRTIVHEFSHYAIGLYDSHFGYELDPDGNPIYERPATCTGLNLDDAINATLMDDQGRSSEFSDRRAPGLWSSACERTAQWQLNHNPGTGASEADWDTIVRRFADPLGQARWQFVTPGDRGAPLAGPTDIWPLPLPHGPEVRLPPPGASYLRHLNVIAPDGLASNVFVSIYTQDNRTIDQGLTDAQGQLTMYGATAGDVIIASSLDGQFTGEARVGPEQEITLELRPVSNRTP